jgi:hypothetical protein
MSIYIRKIFLCATCCITPIVSAYCSRSTVLLQVVVDAPPSLVEWYPVGTLGRS